MARKDKSFDTAYFNNSYMDRSFCRIFVKQRPFCSPETKTPNIGELPSFILIEGGIMILHEEAFSKELEDAWHAYDQQQNPDNER